MHVFQFFQNTRVLWIFICLSATIIPWKGFGLPSSWSQEGGLVILPERNPWIISQNIWGGRTHKESSSPGNGPRGDQSCALGVTGTNLWPAEPSSGQELGFEPRVLLFHSNTHGPKAALEAQGLGTAAPHSALPPGCVLNIKKKFICCTPGHCEILPCQALHPYPGFHWKRPRCRQGELSKYSWQRAGTRRRQMSLTWIHVELPWGQQDSTETQNPDGENLVQSQSWFWVFSDVIVSL